MKLAPYKLLIPLLCALVIACKNRPETKSDSAPAKEVKIEPAEKSPEIKEQPIRINPVPKEQKSDRRIHRKKGKNALDTLRPKTA